MELASSFLDRSIHKFLVILSIAALIGLFAIIRRSPAPPKTSDIPTDIITELSEAKTAEEVRSCIERLPCEGDVEEVRCSVQDQDKEVTVHGCDGLGRTHLISERKCRWCFLSLKLVSRCAMSCSRIGDQDLQARVGSYVLQDTAPLGSMIPLHIITH